MIEMKLAVFYTDRDFCQRYRALQVQVAELESADGAAVRSGDTERARLYGEKLKQHEQALDELTFQEAQRLWASMALDGVIFDSVETLFSGRMMRFTYEEANPFESSA